MSRGKELLVGLVIIIAVLTAVVGTLWLQGANIGRAQIQVEALLESVAQLAEGNVVTYRGVTIGQVATIEVEPSGDAVRITMLLSEEVELPDDAAVVLGPESLFGAWQAEIVSRASYPRFPFLDVHDRNADGVRVLGGYALPELSRLTASAEEISLNLANLTARMELAFNQETADNLASAIDNIEGITEEVRVLVAQQSEVASSIVANADSALSEIAIAARVARSTFESFQGVVGDERLDSVMTNLRVASGDLRTLVAELSDSTGGLATTLGRADSAFASIERITAGLEGGRGTLGRLLVDTTLAVNAEGVLAQLQLLLQDMQANPGRYVRLSIF